MSRGSYLPELTRMALENAWARAGELDLRPILGRCLKAGMSVSEARAAVEVCNGKREPHLFCSKIIKRWRQSSE